MNTIAFPKLPFFSEPAAVRQIAFSIGSLDVRWYGVIIALGVLAAMLYVLSRCKGFGIEPDQLADVLLWALPMGIVGARVYYVVNSWGYYSQNPGDIIKIWNGGLAVYGGIIFGIATAFIYCRLKKIRVLDILDIGCLGILIGQFIGRWANFTNAEAFGGETSLPWGMSINGGIPVHPTFFYEFLWNLVGFVLLHFYSRHRRFKGELALLYAAWYGLGRAWIEGLRADSLYLGSTDIRVSQAIAVISFLAATGGLIYCYCTRKGRKEPANESD